MFFNIKMSLCPSVSTLILVLFHVVVIFFHKYYQNLSFSLSVHSSIHPSVHFIHNSAYILIFFLSFNNFWFQYFFLSFVNRLARSLFIPHLYMKVQHEEEHDKRIIKFTQKASVFAPFAVAMNVASLVTKKQQIYVI